MQCVLQDLSSSHATCLRETSCGGDGQFLYFWWDQGFSFGSISSSCHHQGEQSQDPGVHATKRMNCVLRSDTARDCHRPQVGDKVLLASTRVPVQRRSAMSTAAELRNAKQEPTKRRSLPSNQQAQRLWNMYEKRVEGQSKP